MKDYKFWKRIGKLYLLFDKNNLFEMMYWPKGTGAKTLLKIQF